MPHRTESHARRRYGIENSEENRRAYRQMLFEAPGANNYLSAAILVRAL